MYQHKGTNYIIILFAVILAFTMLVGCSGENDEQEPQSSSVTQEELTELATNPDKEEIK